MRREMLHGIKTKSYLMVGDEGIELFASDETGRHPKPLDQSPNYGNHYARQHCFKQIAPIAAMLPTRWLNMHPVFSHIANEYK